MVGIWKSEMVYLLMTRLIGVFLLVGNWFYSLHGGAMKHD